jgi:sugar lactone lactonase YvrE
MFRACLWLLVLATISLNSSIAAGQMLGLDLAGNIYEIHPGSNKFRLVNSVDSGGNGLAQDRRGNLYTVLNLDGGSRPLATLDPRNASLTIVAELFSSKANTSFDVRAMAFHQNGTLYFVQAGTPSVLYKANAKTGRAMRIGEIAGIAPNYIAAVQGLDFSPRGQLYGWDVFWGLVRIDPSTAKAVDVNGVRDYETSDYAEIQSLAFDYRGRLYGARHDVYQLNPKTGVAKLAGPANTQEFDIRGLAFWPPTRIAIHLLNNSINLRKRTSTVWVAILSDQGSDALQVKPQTLRLGRGAARQQQYKVQDANQDGVPDLLVKFKIDDAGIQCEDESVDLQGVTYAGDRVAGTASINVVKCER